MRFSVNVEITDDEAKKFAEDLARRWTLNTVRDVSRTVRLDPSFLESILSLMQSTVASIREDREPTHPTRPYPCPPPGSPPSPTTGPYPPHEDDAEEKPMIQCEITGDGWVCCHCGSVNMPSRGRCRVCDHERCFMPPPPDPHADEESDA